MTRVPQIPMDEAAPEVSAVHTFIGAREGCA